jgi:hypothetical protein
MPSASSPVKDALESYVAGRVKAERLVIAVSAAYYGDSRNGQRESLQPLIDVIDRASPGIVELGTVQGGSGFAISLAERSFPKQFEPELRQAAQAYLGRVEAGGTAGEGGTAPRGIMARLVAAVRRMFNPSA